MHFKHALLPFLYFGHARAFTLGWDWVRAFLLPFPKNIRERYSESRNAGKKVGIIKGWHDTDKIVDDIIEMDETPIGIRIKAELERQERTVSWLARKINCHRVNIYDIFHRRDIDVKLLVRISIALKHNFIEDYYNEVESHIDGQE